MGAVGRGEAPGRLDSVGLDRAHGEAEHPRHLAGVGREAAGARRPRERVEVPGERGERVGVDHHRRRHAADQVPHERLRLGVEPEPGAERDRAARGRQRREPLLRGESDRLGGRLRQRLGHAFGHQGRHDRLLGARRGDRDEAGAGAHGRPAGEGGRARLADRARDDQQMTELTLVRLPAPRREVASDVGGLEHENAGRLSGLLGGQADRHDANLAREVAARGQQKAALEPLERRRERGTHDRARRLARVGAQPRGQVERDHGEAALVDPSDRVGDEARGRPARSRPEQGVDGQRAGGVERVLEPGDPPGIRDLHRPEPRGDEARELRRRVPPDVGGTADQEHAHARSPAREPPRHHEPVTAVVALAAHHDDAEATERPLVRREEGPDLGGGAAPGVLHERGAGNAQLGDRAPVQGAHLGGGEDGLQGLSRAGIAAGGGALRRAAACPRKSARIAVYSGRQSARAARGISMWSARRGSRSTPDCLAAEAV